MIKVIEKLSSEGLEVSVRVEGDSNTINRELTSLFHSFLKDDESSTFLFECFLEAITQNDSRKINGL